MRRVNTFLFLMFVPAVLLCASVASAGDGAPVLPPPSEVPDDPAALETVQLPVAASDDSLESELSVPQGDADVQIYSTTREDGTRVEEYTRNGRVYMVKITPPGGLPPYYLYDRDGNGTFERRLPGGRKGISPPEWVIKRF